MAKRINAMRDVRKDDTIIAFMGPTGAGKSFFIDLLTGASDQDRRAGNTLTSVASQIEATTVVHPFDDKERVVLVDTPGFDNATISDMQILQMISEWLQITYKADVKLSGLIYLHRITDNRMGATPCKNLRMFGELCGGVFLNQVFLVSTMWGKIKPEIGKAREEELVHRFWEPLIKRGSSVERLSETKSDEAWRIVKKLIVSHEKKLKRETVLLQEEMVDHGIKLNETQAAKVLYTPLQKQLADQKDALKLLLIQMHRSNDPALSKEVTKEYDKIEADFQKTFEEAKKLKVSLGIKIAGIFGGKAPPAPTYYPALSDLILQIINNPSQQARVTELLGDDAQRVADFLSQLLYEDDALSSDDRKYLLTLLQKLVKSAQVLPQCYKLQEVQCDFSKACEGGGFADIFQGQYREQKVCVKAVRVFQRRDNTRMLKAFAKEIVLWAHLSHENILPFYGIYQGVSGRICIISPWMDLGDLSVYLQNFPRRPRLPLVLDITAGLQYLHQSDIVHGDLKAKNILVSSNGRALIADFGISRIVVSTKLVSAQLSNGTLRWMAPELLIDDGESCPPVTLKSDIWSLGCVYYEISTRKVPFYHVSDVQLSSFRRDPKAIPYRPTDGSEVDKISEDMWRLMEKCWESEPCSRHSCNDVHAFVTGVMDVPEQQCSHHVTLWKITRKKPAIEAIGEHANRILLRIRQADRIQHSIASEEGIGPIPLTTTVQNLQNKT